MRKGPPKRKLRADITKMLHDLKESKNDVFKVTVKITTGLIKVVFGNTLCKSIDTTPQH
jgi:hypothetical protein